MQSLIHTGMHTDTNTDTQPNNRDTLIDLHRNYTVEVLIVVAERKHPQVHGPARLAGNSMLPSNRLLTANNSNSLQAFQLNVGQIPTRCA